MKPNALSSLTVRDWVVGIGGLVFAAWACHQTYVATIVSNRVVEAEARGEKMGHDAVQDVLLSSLQGWQQAHDTRTAPLIDEMIGTVRPAVARIPKLEAKIDEINGLVREMHSFLVDRYAMPTSYAPLAPPYEGPTVSALPRQPSSGFIAGENR